MEGLSGAIRQENELKAFQKESIPISICRYFVADIQNSKESTKNLLKLINKFSNITGYKINIQKSTVFLYTNNEQSKNEVKKIQFT